MAANRSQCLLEFVERLLFPDEDRFDVLYGRGRFHLDDIRLLAVVRTDAKRAEGNIAICIGFTLADRT